MTTATTILGLLPMALGFGDGAEIRTPMAVAVICGLLTSPCSRSSSRRFTTFCLIGERYFKAVEA